MQMFKRYIIFIMMCMFLVLSSCVNLKHSNPLDPEYKDEDTEESTNESVLTDLPADSAHNYEQNMSAIE